MGHVHLTEETPIGATGGFGGLLVALVIATTTAGCLSSEWTNTESTIPNGSPYYGLLSQDVPAGYTFMEAPPMTDTPFWHGAVVVEGVDLPEPQLVAIRVQGQVDSWVGEAYTRTKSPHVFADVPAAANSDERLALYMEMLARLGVSPSALERYTADLEASEQEKGNRIHANAPIYAAVAFNTSSSLEGFDFSRSTVSPGSEHGTIYASNSTLWLEFSYPLRVVEDRNITLSASPFGEAALEVWYAGHVDEGAVRQRVDEWLHQASLPRWPVDAHWSYLTGAS